IRYRLLAAHSDAIVDDTDRARVAIMVDPDRKLRVGAQQLGRVERLEAELVAGVGRIRDQLPQEDLAIAVQRVDHQVQELPDLGLEAQGLLFGRARLPARLAGVAHRLGYLVLSWVLLRWTGGENPGPRGSAPPWPQMAPFPGFFKRRDRPGIAAGRCPLPQSGWKCSATSSGVTASKRSGDQAGRLSLSISSARTPSGKSWPRWYRRASTRSSSSTWRRDRCRQRCR